MGEEGIEGRMWGEQRKTWVMRENSLEVEHGVYGAELEFVIEPCAQKFKV